MDRGQKETEAILKQVERRINKEYAQAIDEIEDQLSDYLRRFEIKDKKWQEWVETGYKTKDQYEKWRTQQMAVGQKWSEQKDIIAHELANVNETAKDLTRKAAPAIFAENANYATYQIEKDAKVDTSFTLYSRDSVARLIAEDPEVLPPVGKKVSQDIAMGKAVKWNKQQLQSVMIQGILQGDSIPKLATRLANTVGDRDRKASIRNARTMATAAQNAGRVNAYKRAEDKGVELEQMWIATLDGRTRHSHRWLDGEVRPVGEEFSNGCEYPADPKGDPAEIYNCRCTLRGVVKGLERRSGLTRVTDEGQSYDEWRNGKAKSNPIDLPEQKAKAIKGSYLNEYRYGGKNSNYAKTIQELFAGDTNVESYTISDIIDNLNTSQIGRESLQYIEDHQFTVKAIQNFRTSNRGEQFTDRLEIYTNNIANARIAGQTVVHEVAHRRYNVGGSQLDEAICMATEKMHKENRMYLTDAEWEKMMQLARENYSDLPIKRVDEHYERFGFINKRIGDE